MTYEIRSSVLLCKQDFVERLGNLKQIYRLRRCDVMKPKRLTTDCKKGAQRDFSSFLTTKMSFTGFPEEAERVNQMTQGAVPRKVPSGGSGSRRAKERLLAAAEKKVDAVVACSALPQEARLSAPLPSTPVKLRISDNGRCDVLEANNDKTETKSCALPPNENTLPGTETTNGNPEKDDDNREQADPKKTSEASANKLEMFQEKQKFIEEQNRKRKEMLSKAILDRQKQTDQESRKLQIVQAELAKIDTLLNTDVQFLRESIEQASFEFMKAQKRYEDAEKEFIAAKLHLFGVSERKELLTDHLCSIIEQNEQRKAKRLMELMVELQLDSSKMSSDQGETISLKELRPSPDFNTLKKSDAPEK